MVKYKIIDVNDGRVIADGVTLQDLKDLTGYKASKMSSSYTERGCIYNKRFRFERYYEYESPLRERYSKIVREKNASTGTVSMTFDMFCEWDALNKRYGAKRRQ